MREMKIAAAARAIDFIQSGMKLGIGTGSTAEEFIRLLAVKVAQGLDIVGVATSRRSEALCKELHIPVFDHALLYHATLRYTILHRTVSSPLSRLA